MKFTKVKRERASDSVCNILRESILDQTFLPGQRLDVKLLAEKLDVSLTPIKDAITRLVVEGLDRAAAAQRNLCLPAFSRGRRGNSGHPAGSGVPRRGNHHRKT